MVKANRNVFPRGLVNLLESRPKYTIENQSTSHPPLIPVPQTQSKSVWYLTNYELPKLTQLHIRPSSKRGCGTPCLLVMSGTVTILAHNITSHSLLSLKVSSTCGESFGGFTPRQLVTKIRPKSNHVNLSVSQI
jgi:hypothetical protein